MFCTVLPIRNHKMPLVKQELIQEFIAQLLSEILEFIAASCQIFNWAAYKTVALSVT